mmetsp:Transcript_39228/g.83545  ORF Transcript_39228/g.83545 Transcript_39228/m.83545 type:complete len:200 (+) Transcript_39228:986-1585(+)
MERQPWPSSLGDMAPMPRRSSSTRQAWAGDGYFVFRNCRNSSRPGSCLGSTGSGIQWSESLLSRALASGDRSLSSSGILMPWRRWAHRSRRVRSFFVTVPEPSESMRSKTRLSSMFAKRGSRRRSVKKRWISVKFARAMWWRSMAFQASVVPFFLNLSAHFFERTSNCFPRSGSRCSRPTAAGSASSPSVEMEMEWMSW